MHETTDQTINISEFFRFIVKHWFLPVIFLVLAPILGYAYTSLQTPLYDSTAQLVVLDSGSANISRNVLLGNYVTLAKSPKVLDAVSEHVEEDTDTLAKNLEVQNDNGTEVITLRYSSPTKYHAADIVQRVVDSFTEQLGDLYNIKPASIVTFAYPTDSESPYNIDYTKNIALALAGAIVLVIVIEFIRFDRAKSHSQPLDTSPDFKREEKARQKKILADKESLRQKEIAARASEIEARAIEAKVRSAEAEANIAAARASQSAAAANDTENRSRIAEAEARIEAASALKKKVELESIYREEQLKEAAATNKKQSEIARERMVELEKINTEKAVIEAKTQLSIARAVADRRFKSTGTPISALQPLVPTPTPATPPPVTPPASIFSASAPHVQPQ